MNINQYSLYLQQANSTVKFVAGRFNVIKSDLEKINTYNDVKEYLERNFGNIAEGINPFELPEQYLLVVFFDSEGVVETYCFDENDSLVYSKGWKFTPIENDKKTNN